MPQKSNYSRLAQLRQSDRFRRAQQDPTLLQGLTPTQIAELFPDYFKRGTPDVGGFREAISRESARKQGLWQGSVDSRLDQQGGMLGRMRREYGGGSTVASGNLKQNQQEAYKAARAEGLSDSAARILVANMSGESLKNPGDHHWDRSHMSQGIVQWDPARAERIKNHFGAYPKDMSVADQTKAAIWEMKTYYGASYSALTNDKLPADERMETVVSDYERPQDVGGAVSTRLQYYRGLQIAEDDGKGGTPKQGDQKTGQTTGQQQGQTTPGSGGGGGTGQQAPINYNVVDGYIVPKDNSLYDPRNAQQCATLSKAMNPAIGRSSGWTVVDGEIKPGVVVATKQYNNSGADKVHSGYHTGVALSAPNEKGDFLLLEQYNGSGGAKTRWVNKDSYPIGDSGKTTSFGLISSGGKVHDEVSQEALAYGQKLGAGSAGQGGTPGTGGDTAPGVEGGVEYSGGMGGSSIGEGEQQSASLMQPVAMMQNLMGMMGGMIPQTAVPLGLITSALGFIMPLIGSLAGERLSGEGMGDGPRRGHRGHRLSQHRMHGVAGRIELNRESKADLAAKQSSPVSGPVELGDPSRAQKFLSLIAKGEGGYNSMNQGTVKGRIVGSTNDSSKVVGRKLTDMTIGEIMDMQKGSIKSGRKLFAVGKYQIIPDTMKIVAKTAGLKPEDKFDEATQEKLGMALIHKRPDLHAYLTGKSNNETAALRAAAEEWASLPDPHTGRSVYGHGNKSSHSVESVRAALRETRTEMLSAGQTQMANATPPTPEVRAAAATGQVRPTPTGMPGPTTQIVRTEPTFIERVRTLGGLGTAGRASAGTTPSPSIPVSTNISATKAPAIPFSREARNQEGIYGSFKRSDIEHQFGKGKQISLPSYMQQNNQEIIRQPSATVEPVKSTPGASPASTPMPVTRGVPAAPAAPGPAPDTVSTQMRNMNETMAAIQTRDAAAAKGPTREPERPIPQATHTEENMRNISQPFDNPSFHRAMSRAHGSETKGEVGQNHFTGPGDTSYAE